MQAAVRKNLSRNLYSVKISNGLLFLPQLAGYIVSKYLSMTSRIRSSGLVYVN